MTSDWYIMKVHKFCYFPHKSGQTFKTWISAEAKNFDLVQNWVSELYIYSGENDLGARDGS